MKNKTCKRHRAQPEFIYTDCVDCEIESYNSDLAELKGDLAELKEKYRWRDVKVELPVDGGSFLTRYHNDVGHVDHWVTKPDYKGEKFYWVFERASISKITHWMPMPSFEVEG